MKHFLIALQFLTIIPIKIKQEISKEDFAKSLIYFPPVGAIIGILLVGILFSLNFLPPLVISAIMLITLILITGGIHLDGFIDSCDGLYGSRTKEKRLEIMRDPHAGAMGVIGAVCLLILKFALLSSFPKTNLWKLLILMPVFSRWAQVFACYISIYARSDGKAKYFIENITGKKIVITTSLTISIFILLLKINGIIIFFADSIIIFFLIKWIKNKIGGMTGDTIGAVNEIAEVCVLLSGLILLFCFPASMYPKPLVRIFSNIRFHLT